MHQVVPGCTSRQHALEGRLVLDVDGVPFDTREIGTAPRQCDDVVTLGHQPCRQ
jgi:hypothetical protein